MKTCLSLIFLIILTACNSRSIDKPIKNTPVDTTVIKSKVQQKDTVDIHIDTLQINNQKYIEKSIDGRFNCLWSIQGDTIVKSEDYYFNADFVDIDEDGYKDIRIYFVNNTPNQCDNYLFVKDSKTFKIIEDCDLDIHKIKGSQFYYSYNRAGCADMNWESYLSKIENYKLVDYGYIYGKGCDEIKDNLRVIEIYKFGNSETDDKILVKKLPYRKYIPEFSDKWDFIEKYWKQNLKTFDR